MALHGFLFRLATSNPKVRCTRRQWLNAYVRHRWLPPVGAVGNGELSRAPVQVCARQSPGRSAHAMVSSPLEVVGSLRVNAAHMAASVTLVISCRQASDGHARRVHKVRLCCEPIFEAPMQAVLERQVHSLCPSEHAWVTLDVLSTDSAASAADFVGCRCFHPGASRVLQ